MDKVGIVTETEKEQVLLLYERKNALKELIMTLDGPIVPEVGKKELLIRIEADRQRTDEAYDRWWTSMSMKYRWDSDEKRNWKIDFETNEVFLV